VPCRGIGWARSRKRAEDLHGPAAARTEVKGAVASLYRLVSIGRRSRAAGEELPAEDDFFSAMTIAEKTVMANAVKAG
jgi:hypothetical protein